ncbi:MAG: Fic family protein [Saprospiraceae bacterium]|nr:Fic family protein [Saprospiraceae bacterium]
MNRFDSGRYVQQGSHKSFIPNEINRHWTISDPEILTLLGQADRHLGRLDMFSEYVPNIDLFIGMHVLVEATQSSKIEGTQTRIGEALLREEDIPADRKDDWQEVQNYMHALNTSIHQLEELPISSRLIRNAHRLLMQAVRGEHKQPGEFRQSQNWIGGATLQDALFIPPPHTEVPRLMADLEHFIHNEEIQIPELIKIAIVHYQFETIHPFLDGNGRVGRLLIPLYLVSRTLLKKPLLYLSDFFEKNRQHYYDNLMYARTNHHIKQWIRFFLVGVIETSRKGAQTFDQVLKLKDDIDAQLRQLGRRASNAQKAMDVLYRLPVIDAETLYSQLDVSLPTIYKLISNLEQMDILKEITGNQRGRYYAFERYLSLFDPGLPHSRVSIPRS